MANKTVNLFWLPREPRDKIVTIRMTESEHTAVERLAKKRKTDNVDIIRAALAAYLGDPKK